MKIIIKRILIIGILSMLLNGEFYKYGFAILAVPQLFVLYITYAVAVEDIAGKCRLDARGLFIIGAVYGLVLEAVFTRSLFADPPFLFGVNWLTVAIQSMYWGLLATVLPFHFSSRIAPRPSPGLNLGLGGWLVIAFIYIIIALAWLGSLPPLREPGLAPVAVLIFLLIAILLKRRSKNTDDVVAKNRVLDMFTITHLVLGLIVGIILRSLVLPLWIFAGLALGIVSAVLVFGKKQLAVQNPV